MIDYLNIGLDFGTHQSKVCIEDTADPRNRIYTFFRFTRPDGKKTFFLPSVVQINKDRTLSYGFVDESKALVLGQKHTFPEPKLVKPNQPPLLPVPEKPVEFRTKSLTEFLSTLPNHVRYKDAGYSRGGRKHRKALSKDLGRELYSDYCRDLQQKNKTEYFKWQAKCASIKSWNDNILARYKSDCEAANQDYLARHTVWENSLTDEKAVYRYFKIAAFTKNSGWEGDISPKVLSTWYVTYVLFCIFEEYPDDLSFQMGIPESIGDKYSRTQRKNAEDIFYSAYTLYEFFGKKKAFLKATVDELKRLMEFNPAKRDYTKGSQVMILPEAFAGLLTITQQGKISTGMNLLVDIGGGSTDILLFNVIRTRNGIVPNISRIISIHRGLNYIYSLYSETHYDMDLEQIRKLFVKNPSAFKSEIATYRKELVDLVQDEFYSPLFMAGLKQGISKERIYPIIAERPVIYSGGGSVFAVFHKGLHVFSEPVSVSKDLLSLKNVTEKNITDDELSILAVAYGLSIPQVSEPEMTPLEDLFSHIHIVEQRAARPTSYEHGMTDVD